PATGRCEPRGRTWPYSPVVSTWESPPRRPPRAAGFSISPGVNAIFTGPELSWPRFGDACPSGLPPWLLRRGREGRRHGRTRARAVRQARLRAEADRPQHARRPRPRG